MRKSSLTVLMIALLGLLYCIGNALGQGSEEDRVEQYLLQLRLDTVLAEHLQQQLNDTLDRTEQIQIAARLARLYSRQVFSGKVDDGAEVRFQRILQLARDFPEIDSPDLKMTVLHSQYASAEKRFLDWVDEGRDSDRQFELASQLRTIGGKLRLQISQLENTIFEGSDERLFAQAHYLYGWVSYYMGILEPSEQRTWMQRSNQSFREFLEIDPDKPINGFSVQWFAIQSPWHARAQIGLGMCLEGLDEPEQSKFCFDILESLESDAQLEAQLDVWRLNRFVYLGDATGATQFLKRRSADRQLDIKQRTRLWVAAIDAASMFEGGMYSKDGVRFLRMGIHGLLSDMNAPVLQDLVQRENLKLGGEDFLLAWCRGYLKFFEGESSGSVEALMQAKDELSWALQAANAATRIEDVSKIRFLLGWIEFQQNEYEAASDLLGQTIPELADTSPELASEAQWLIVRCFQSLALSDPRYSNDAFEAMDKLVRLFPHSKYVRRVEFEKLLMEVSKFPPQEAIRRLGRVQREDPNFNDAMFHQIVLQHRIWKSQSKPREPESQRSLNRLLDMEREFQQLYPSPSISKRLKAAILTVDALISSADENGVHLATNQLNQARSLSDSIDPRSPLLIELRYYQFQMARAQGDQDSIQQQATWFYETEPNSRFCLPVLVAVAQDLQRQVDAEDSISERDYQQLAEAYRRLTNLLGATPETLARNQNARFSAFKLAEYELILKRPDQADPLLDALLKAFPNRRSYWLLSARTKMQQKQYDKALDGWRQIVGATEPGVDDWFEAKLGIVICLESTNPKAAAALLTQTANLAPDRPEKWQTEFDRLAKRLGVTLDAEREDRQDQ